MVRNAVVGYQDWKCNSCGQAHTAPIKVPEVCPLCEKRRAYYVERGWYYGPVILIMRQRETDVDPIEICQMRGSANEQLMEEVLWPEAHKICRLLNANEGNDS